MSSPKHQRRIQRQPDEWWPYLSIAQRFSANSLFRYGYQLAFIRNNEKGKLAVLIREDNIVTLNEWGDLDTAPAITLRH